MSGTVFDLVIVGAGPGGYVAAIRGAQLGMRVTVIEKRVTLGGVCLNEGCIPSKALLDSSEHFATARDKLIHHGIEVNPLTLNLDRMLARKDDVVKKLTDGIAYLFKKNKIDWLRGSAVIKGSAADGIHDVEVTGADFIKVVRGRRVLLATGSIPVELPVLPFNGNTVVDAKGALSFSSIPEHLMVIGAGSIGLELGSIWRRLGAKVTVVEMLSKMLPNTDGEMADALMRILKKQGLNFRMGTHVTAAASRDGKAVVTIDCGDEGAEIVCDKVLVAAGRRAATANLGLERVGITLDRFGRIPVDENYETSLSGLYAIGDLVPGPMLAHKASEEGVVCVERIAGQTPVVNYDTLPSVCYTWPEAASVGKTEEILKDERVPYAVGKSRFINNGRARCMDETDGFVKVLAHKESDKILGVHILDPRASDMIAEAVAVLSHGGKAHEVSAMFHGHPTLSEALKEAALDVANAAVHA